MVRLAVMFHLAVEEPYNFAQSVQDHGWIRLAPSTWLEDRQSFQYVSRLAGGKVVLTEVTVAESDTALSLAVTLDGTEPLRAAERGQIERDVRWMLRLDEDLSPFYDQAATDPHLWQTVRTGRGRLLRSPALFEDVVKTICTTNTTWRQTKAMVQRLVQRLGSPYPHNRDLRAFPTPEQIAAAPLDVLQTEVRLGYRSTYVHELAKRVVQGELDLEALKQSALPSSELKKQLKAIKGVGDYAANTLLMLLGRYDKLAIDSEARAFVSQKYYGGRPATDQDILSIYEKWGAYQYLAHWFDSLS